MKTQKTEEPLMMVNHVNHIQFDDPPSEPEDGTERKTGPYQRASRVQEKAEELIADYHPHLEAAKIAYLFRTGPWKSRNQTVPGKAAIAQQMWQFLSGIHLVLIINQLVWQNLTNNRRRALLDHQLSHFTEPKTDKAGILKWGTREPDLKEFSQVIKRHGICIGDPQPLKELSGQMNLQALQESSDAGEFLESRESTESEESLGGEFDDDDLEECFTE